LDAPSSSTDELIAGLRIEPTLAKELLTELQDEGFIASDGDGWRIA
jgi:DNA-binding IclR family transcriptional regulator